MESQFMGSWNWELGNPKSAAGFHGCKIYSRRSWDVIKASASVFSPPTTPTTHWPPSPALLSFSDFPCVVEMSGKTTPGIILHVLIQWQESIYFPMVPMKTQGWFEMGRFGLNASLESTMWLTRPLCIPAVEVSPVIRIKRDICLKSMQRCTVTRKISHI